MVSQPVRYADFTKKQPFELGTQMSLPGEGLEGTGMERIACADGVSNRALTKSVFEQRRTGSKSWHTNKGF